MAKPTLVPLQALEALVNAINAELAEFAPRYVTPAKKAVFRIYRDTRFSKDKSPYKTAAAAVTEGEGGAAYYVQISAEGLYVGDRVPDDGGAAERHIGPEQHVTSEIREGAELGLAIAEHDPHDRGRHVRVGRQLPERIAGGERQHREQHDADAEQAGKGDQQPPEEISPHDSVISDQ